MIKQTAGILILGSALILTFLSACSEQIILPPINSESTAEYIHGKFIWHDLLTDDPGAVIPFYKSLFGWEFKSASLDDDRYLLISHNGKQVGGMVAIQDLKKDVEYSQWLPYLSVESVENTADYFVERGGKIERAPYEMLNRGMFAAVTDPQGAVVALLKSSSGDIPDSKPKLNEWLWNELWAENKNDALEFYVGMIGYEVEEIEALDSSIYHTLQIKGKPRAGILEIPIKNVKPHWLSYIAVDNVSEYKKKAEELGGRALVFVEGTKRGSAAIIADPSGAVFGIQQWPISGGGTE